MGVAMAKAKGRPRKTGQRYRGGRIVPQRDALVPAEVEQRRRKLLGDTDPHSTLWRRDARLGTVLGQMQLTGKISYRQYEAGMKVAEVWQKWARMAECPSRHAAAANLPVATTGEAEALTPGEIDALIRAAEEDDDGRWRRLSATMRMIRVYVRDVEHPALAISILETVCLDDLMPPRLEQDNPLATKCWDALKAALDAAAGLFRIPESREAA